MKILYFIFLYLSFLSACTPTATSESDVSTTPDFSKLNSSCFVQQSTSPIIGMGDLFAGANWNDPHVLKVGNQFVMYASADTNFSENIKIYRLVSSNGINWNLSPSSAVFEKSTDPLAWDRKSTETPGVVFFNGLYYLFYIGYPITLTDPTSYNVGYATSPDGITWTRQTPRLIPTDPLGAPNLDFNQYVVGEPAPVVFNNKIYLYFTASGAHLSVNSTLFTIGLVTSTDGATWSAPQMVLSPDQAIYPRSTWLGYSTPHAVVLNNQMHLFFDVAKDPFKQEKFHHAVSTDGITGWTQDSTAIFDKSQIPWADDQINGPAVLLDEKNLYFWFAGQGNLGAFPNISMGIGLAICPL